MIKYIAEIAADKADINVQNVQIAVTVSRSTGMANVFLVTQEALILEKTVVHGNTHAQYLQGHTIEKRLDTGIHTETEY